MNIDLDKAIEAILFFKGEPISKDKLGKLLNAKRPEIDKALNLLEKKLDDRGIVLSTDDEEVMLGTASECASIIETMLKEEQSREISKAGLETLSIIVYKGPISRSEIDHIRGVNSTYILRNLLVRGLIEKIPQPNDERSYLYKPTIELQHHLGLKKLEDLPEYREVRQALYEFKENMQE